MLGECVDWGKSLGAGGYGQEWCPIEKTMKRAHRMAWAKANGPIPEGLHVLHDCDRPSCVNVDHLYLGTHDDNMRDMSVRRRVHGERNSFCKLSDEVVGAIRRIYSEGVLHQYELAYLAGVRQSHVSRIVNRKNRV